MSADFKYLLTTVKPCIAIVLSLLCLAATQDTKDQFFAAVRKGDLETVRSLLAQGFDVNTPFRYGATALSYAADRGYTDMVKELLDRGANANVRDTFYGASPMVWAVEKGHIEVVRLLLQKGAPGRDQALANGVRGGNLQLVRIALEGTGIPEEMLTAALAYATEKNQAEIAEALRHAGAKPALQLEQSDLAPLVGSYRSPNGPDLRIEIQNGRLVSIATGRPLPLVPVDKTRFASIEGPVVVVVFERDVSGSQGFTVRAGPRETRYSRVEEK